MNEHLLLSTPTLANKNPVFLTGPALSDCAASFASANKEYLTIPSNSSLQTGDIDFEIGGWVRLDTLVSESNIFTKWDTGKNEFALWMFGGKLRLSCGAYYLDSSVIPTNNTWYYVRAGRNSISKQIFINVNGTNDSAAAVTAPTSSTAVVLFGSRADDKMNYLNGRLDSWYFTKRISTTAEATSLYNGGAGRTYDQLTAANGLDTFKAGLTSWWDFNEAEGVRYDSKGSNHLTAAADPIVAPPVYGSELVLNPSFETVTGNDFDSWIENAGDGAVVDEGTLVHSGSHAVKMTFGTNGTFIYQTKNVTAGKTYYFSFWSRGDGTNAGKYSIYDVTNSTYITALASTNNSTTTYQLFTVQVTAPAGCSNLRFYLASPSVTGGVAYFDDVSVKEIITPSINNGGFDERPATGGEKTNVSTVSRSRTSNVATMVATAHGLKNGDVVTITGMTDATFNGTNKTVTVVDADTFTYASTGSDAGSAADTGGRIATDVFSSWSDYELGLSTLNAEFTAPYIGNYAARLDVDASNAFVGVSQSIALVGKRYTYSFYAKSSVSGKELYASIGPNITHTLTTSYALYSGTITATGTSFGINRTTANSSSIYIDQVTLTSLGPTAEAGIAAGNAIDGNFAAGFNGASAMYLSRASNASLQGTTPNWGVGCWVYLNSKATQQVLIAKGTSLTVAANLEYALYYDNVTDKFKWSISDGTTIVTATSTATSPTIGNWYYVQGYRSDTGVIGIRVNNGNADTASTALNSQVVNGAFAIGNISAGALAVNGRIDAGYKMNRLFTAGELTSLYNGGKGVKYAGLPTSITTDGLLMGYWNLDEKSGNYSDSTMYANTLTNNGTVTQVQGVGYYEGSVARLQDLTANLSHFNQVTLAKRPVYDSLTLRGSLLFDGVDDGLVKTGDVIGVGDVTLCAVIKARGWGGGNYGRIIDRNDFFIALQNTGLIQVTHNTGATSAFSSTSSIALNASYVIVITRTSAGIVNIYINGVLSGNANQNSGTPVAGSNTYIGNRAAGDRAFDGHIGRVAVIKRILSLGEIQAISRRLSVEYGGIY